MRGAGTRLGSELNISLDFFQRGEYNFNTVWYFCAVPWSKVLFFIDFPLYLEARLKEKAETVAENNN